MQNSRRRFSVISTPGFFLTKINCAYIVLELYLSGDYYHPRNGMNINNNKLFP